MGGIRLGLLAILAIALAVPLAAPAAADEAVRAGRFHEGPHGGHPISGGAAIHALAGGGYELRLDGAFRTVPGPDLVVYVSAAPDAEDDATVASGPGFSAGRLQAVEGPQSYPLPAEFDPASAGSVVIWCQRYGVQFGTAPLSAE